MADYSVYGKTINGGDTITVTKQPGVETETIGFSSVPVLGVGQEVKLVWRAFVHNEAVVREEVLESYGGVYRYGVTNEMEALVGETITAQLQVKFAGSVWRSAPFTITISPEVHITTLPELVTTVAGHAVDLEAHATTIAAQNALLVKLNAPTIVTVAESKTLALTDAGTVQKVTAAAVITIPLNATVALPIGGEIVVLSYTDGEVSIAAADGVTLYSASSYAKIGAQYGAATLKKMAANEWVLYGSLKA